MNDPLRPWIWSAAGCVLAVLLWFSPWWAGGKNLAALDLLHERMSPWAEAGGGSGNVANHMVSDNATQYLIYRRIAERDYTREGRVGWSSLTYGGTAQHANTMALYDDWTMQLHRWLPFWTAWHLGLMGQVLVAALGMLAFLRGRKVGAGWAFVGALLWALNSQFVTWAHHRWALGSFCWLGWVLAGIDASSRGSRWAGATVPVTLALGFLGGTLQHMALLVLAVICRWAEEVPDAGKDLRAQAERLGRYAGWGLLALGLSAFSWLPAVEGFLVTNRLGIHTGLHGNAEAGVYPEGWLQPIFNAAAYPLQVFPWLLGRAGTLDLLKLFKSDLFYVAYVGTLPGIVAFLAVFWRRTPRLARILILAGLLLPLTPLVRPLYQRLFLLFLFGAVYAFADFMTHGAGSTREKLGRWLGRGAAAATAMWLVASVAMTLVPGLEERFVAAVTERLTGSTFGYYREWMAGRVRTFWEESKVWHPASLAALGLLFAAAIGLKWTGSGDIRRQRRGRILVGAAAVLEVTFFAARWVAWSDAERYPAYPETPEVVAIRERAGEDGRVITLPHTEFHMALTPFVSNTLAAYGIASLQGYDSIVPDGMAMRLQQKADPREVARAGVTHLITWPGNPDVPEGWQRVWENGKMELYENPFRVPKTAGFEDEPAVAGFVGGADVEVMALQEETGLENDRRFRVPAGVGAVRLAENEADGWEFRIDGGAWRDVAAAPDASMMLDLGGAAGAERLVEMRYRPPLRRIGGWIALACGVVLVVRRR